MKKLIILLSFIFFFLNCEKEQFICEYTYQIQYESDSPYYNRVTSDFSVTYPTMDTIIANINKLYYENSYLVTYYIYERCGSNTTEVEKGQVSL